MRCKRSAYVSIDLDFWNDKSFDSGCRLVQHVASLGVPIAYVNNHAYMLKYCGEHSCDSLVNIDFHSDIVGDAELVTTTVNDKQFYAIGCGNWVNFVPWRTGAEYTWITPFSMYEGWTAGNCSGCEEDDEDNPFITAPSGWKTVQLRFDAAERTYKRVFERYKVKAVGIAFSADYISPVRRGHNYLPLAQARDRVLALLKGVSTYTIQISLMGL